MLLRLCKSLAVAGLLMLISYTSGLQAEAPAFEIPYFPEVVFTGKPLTVHVRGPEELAVEVVQEKTDILRLEPTGHPLREITLFPEQGQQLSFAMESMFVVWDFALLEPGFEGGIVEKDGYLFANDAPVILMPEHRLPPPLDRRWETVEMVENMIQPQKPLLQEIRALMPEDSPLREELQELLPGSEISLRPPEAEAWFRVHGYLTGKPFKESSFVVVEADLFDFERGMSPKTWFMKWQFLLQHLQSRTGYEDGLLVGPAYTAENIKWKPVLETPLRGLASAHGLRFVDRSLPPEVWKERLLNQLGKTYKLP